MTLPVTPLFQDPDEHEAEEITAPYSADPALIRRAKSSRRPPPLPHTLQSESGLSRLTMRTTGVAAWDARTSAGEDYDPSVQTVQPSGQSASTLRRGITVHAPPARRMVHMETLRLVLDEYTEYAGPAARPIMLATIAELRAEPSKFSWDLRGALLLRLASRLDDPTTRELFLAQASAIIERS